MITPEFHRLWFKTFISKRGYEPGQYDIKSVGEAVQTLRMLSGLTREEFAMRVSMTVNTITVLERRGRPRTGDQMKQFQDFAQLLSLYSLRAWFEHEARIAFRTSKHNRQPRDLDE